MTEAAVHRPEHKPETRSPSQPLMVLVWIAFIALMAFDAATLDRIWSWLRGLPLAAEIVLWIVALPWVLGLAVWQASWDTWIRVVVILLLALFWSSIFGAKR
ncbi:MAG TPA: hypothetical protein VF895_09370 [Gaiellaceae bacterium]